ncbi:uncharacterized protein LOC128663103 [Bombina bombina]|uniref:uncharacterized protein LOC128663103 n=1 Tax=Bombina bombina TaxID=8345 RepID=UPI00235AD712|nr:uncharacterized protein LOC128663103 [Bombina bombina]
MAESQEHVADLPTMIETVQICKDTRTQQSRRLCKFFSQGQYCQFGKRCRFLHQYIDNPSSYRSHNPTISVVNHKQGNITDISASSSTREVDSGLEKKQSQPQQQKYQYRPRKLCRYFLAGYCALERNCRFWHGSTDPPLNDDNLPNKKQPEKKMEGRSQEIRPCFVPEEIKISDITPEITRQLREKEITKLMKRIPKDKLIVQEREDKEVTYYRFTVEPTDPDWPFDLKEIEILVEFPVDYPLQVFNIQVPEDQDLPSVMGRHACEASVEWLKAKHATNQLMGKVELLFSPFLRWLDRNMERLFTEGARLLKRDIDAEKAGIEFVPYQQLQAAVSVTSSEAADHPKEHVANLQQTSSENSEDDSDSWISCDEDEDLDPGTEAADVQTVDAVGPRRGSEIRLLALRLGEGVGTALAHRILVSLQCNRCKVTADLSLVENQPCSAQCEKCNSNISGTFHPTIMHQFSAILGYVDIKGAVPKDLILQDSFFMIGCLNCSQEAPVQDLSYGIIKELNCLSCHSKLNVFTEAAKFQKVERFAGKVSGLQNQNRKKTLRDPSIQLGKPLPDQGTCRHYRKSHRWLRFPCCGKTYPCDVCHNTAENHEMELATRMICGFCSKEQPYGNGKPCIYCANMMGRGSHAIHWEGGKGCRNKVKMSRKDKQKYANSSKTLSRKSISKK